MAKDVLPMRFRVLHFAAQNDVFTYHDILEAIKDEYNGEKQYNKDMVLLHMDSLRAVGMLEEVDVQFEGDQELLVSYRITDYGRSRLSYLPEEWKRPS